MQGLHIDLGAKIEWWTGALVFCDGKKRQGYTAILIPCHFRSGLTLGDHKQAQ